METRNSEITVLVLISLLIAPQWDGNAELGIAREVPELFF